MKRNILKKALAGVLILCLLLLASCAQLSAVVSDIASDNASDTTASGSSGSSDAITYTSAQADTAADAEAAKAEITDDFTVVTDVENGYTVNGSVYTVTAAGEYTLSGKIADGQILVNAGDDDEVTLILSGVSITCSTDSPIYIENADKVKIKVAADTYNEINDTRALQTDENDTTGPAAIYAKCDLNLIGTGNLVVNATYNNGIHTKDDLKIKNLTLKVTAPNNAIKGNDSLTIESGEIIAISTSGDALKTENSDVSGKGNQRGTVTISGGTLMLYAANDGIDAAYDVVISGDETNLTINTNSYSDYTSASLRVSKTSSAARNPSGFGVRPGASSSSASSSTSTPYKGIKADNAITISGGVIVINSMDDAIHANNDVALENGETPKGNITISGGSITVNATDDGIHADGTLLITGGYIDVQDSYEGLEGHYITIEGGETHVYATDDAVNATGSTKYSSDGLITVSGGKLFAEVAGNDVDGIDANGSYKQTGGIVVVSNPNADSSGNMSAVDVDNTVSVTGGIIIALGTVPSGGGMGGGRGGPGSFGMGGATSSSSLPSGYVTISGTTSAGTHTVTYGGSTATFTLKNTVRGGWVWADGSYTLK